MSPGSMAFMFVVLGASSVQSPRVFLSTVTSSALGTPFSVRVTSSSASRPVTVRPVSTSAPLLRRSITGYELPSAKAARFTVRAQRFSSPSTGAKVMSSAVPLMKNSASSATPVTLRM